MTELLKTSEIVEKNIKHIENLIAKKDLQALRTFLPGIMNHNFRYVTKASNILLNVGKPNDAQSLRIVDAALNILFNSYELYKEFNGKIIKVNLYNAIDTIEFPEVDFETKFYSIFSCSILLKDSEKSSVILSSIEEIIPNFSKSHEAFYDLAVLCYEQKNYQKSLEFLNLSLSKNENYDMSNHYKARILFELGNLEESEIFIKRALKINSKLPEAHNIKGLLHYNCSMYEEAIECFEKAIELSPQNSNPHHNMGLCLRDLGKFTKALLCHEKAIKIKPSWYAPYSSIGNIYYLQNNMLEAKKYYIQAQNLSEKHPEPYFNLANILCLEEKYDESIENYKKALNSNFEFIESAYFKIGSILSLQNKFSEAIEYLEKAISIIPGDKYTQHYLGYSYLKTGNHDQALYYLKLASDQGFTESQFELGLCYLNGTGVVKDQNKSIQLLTNAKNQGHELAKIVLDSISNITNPEFLAQKKIHEYRELSVTDQKDFDALDRKTEYKNDELDKLVNEERSRSLKKRLIDKTKNDLLKSRKLKQTTNDDQTYKDYYNVTHPNNDKSVLKVRINEKSSDILKFRKNNPSLYERFIGVAHQGKFVCASGRNGHKYIEKKTLELKIAKEDIRLRGEIIKDKQGVKSCILDKVTTHTR